MPNWTDHVPDAAASTTHRLKRTPTGGRILAIATSANLLGCNTHFYHGRTQPCEAPLCEPCAQGLGWRFHCYLAAVDAQTDEHFIFECTATPAEAFARYRQANGSLRGCLFEATRSGAKMNGRVSIRCKPADQTTRPLPDPPDLQAILCMLWNVPKQAAQPADAHRSHPQITVDTTRDAENNGRKERHTALKNP